MQGLLYGNRAILILIITPDTVQRRLDIKVILHFGEVTGAVVGDTAGTDKYSYDVFGKGTRYIYACSFFQRCHHIVIDQMEAAVIMTSQTSCPPSSVWVSQSANQELHLYYGNPAIKYSSNDIQARGSTLS